MTVFVVMLVYKVRDYNHLDASWVAPQEALVLPIAVLAILLLCYLRGIHVAGGVSRRSLFWVSTMQQWPDHLLCGSRRPPESPFAGVLLCDRSCGPPHRLLCHLILHLLLQRWCYAPGGEDFTWKMKKNWLEHHRYHHPFLYIIQHYVKFLSEK